MTQASVSPPTFVLLTSARGPRARLHFAYERYIANRRRDAFGFFCDADQDKAAQEAGQRAARLKVEAVACL